MPAIMNKQELLAKVLKSLEKKLPPPVVLDPPRAVLEELLYAVIREGTTSELADAVFKRFKGSFFDWNEVRVSTVPEITEALSGVPNASRKGQRIIELLQDVFELHYSFDLTDLDKKGLKQAAKQLGRFNGVNDFSVAWVTQRSLAGHAIPLDEPTIRVLRRLNVLEEEVDDTEAVRGTVEHLVPKANDVAFTEHVTVLAETVCLEKPKCGDCPLKADCPTGLENTKKSAEPKPKPKSR
jgi:endonuclease III